MKILGVDAGGTGTRVMYGSVESFESGDYAAIRTAYLGPGNFRHLGKEGVIRLFRQIVDLLGIADTEGTVVVAGFAGAGTPESEETLRRIAREEGFLHPDLLITSDVGLLLRALHDHGILLVAGTGSICMGRKNGRRDTTVRAGGWGYRLGDGGSGYYLGLKAIDAALKVEDGVMPPTESVLYDLVKAYFELDNLAGITDILYPVRSDESSLQERIAGLAGSVIDAAQNGDSQAEHIMVENGKFLAEYVHAVYKRLGSEVSVVGLHGGLFKHPHADTQLIDRLSSHPILAGLCLQFTPLGLHAADSDPLVDAIRFSI